MKHQEKIGKTPNIIIANYDRDMKISIPLTSEQQKFLASFNDKELYHFELVHMTSAGNGKNMGQNLCPKFAAWARRNPDAASMDPMDYYNNGYEEEAKKLSAAGEDGGSKTAIKVVDHIVNGKPYVVEYSGQHMVPNLDGGWVIDPKYVKTVKKRPGCDGNKPLGDRKISISFDRPILPMKMRKIPSGSFVMGTPGDKDSPQHNVTITKPFWLAETPVTQRMWDYVIVYSTSDDPSPDEFPERFVSWENAKEFCRQIGNWYPAPKGYE